jgi:hypothetical protein
MHYVLRCARRRFQLLKFYYSLAPNPLALKDRYSFKTEMDDEAWRAMFPHLQARGA